MALAPEHWQEVQRLFHDASEMPEEKRQAFLRDECTDDDVRREVEALLGRHAQEPTPGQMLDRYLILERIGSGGMGAVYSAEDTRLGRTVALKFLLEQFTGDTSALERFRTEARILSSLNHPNICVIYDICEAEDRTFIAMEYVSGARLDSLIARSSMSPSDILKYAIEIAAGLAKAHAAGIIHRDLKPGNIMITDDRQVKLLDFGIAKLIHGAEVTSGDDAPTLTAFGAIVGTAAYMSPEQAEAKRVDARSDVFAFGAVLYEMITGRRAFEGETAIATLAAVLRSEPEPVRTVAPSSPPELDRIVARCLRKDPERRFQTAADLKVALEEIRDETEAGRLLASGSFGAAPATQQSSTVQPAPAKFTPARKLLAAALVVVLVLAIAGAFAFFRNRGAIPPIPADKRIAVLLFDNVGGNPANQILCDGLMEDVSNSLSRLEQFRGSLVVVPASDVIKEGVRSAGAAGKLLGANLAITGSVERIPNGRVHVLINLVDTRTVTQLRTESIDTREPDLPNLQDAVMEKVTGMLDLVLNAEAERAMKGGTTQHAGAYVEYIKGLGYLRRYDKVSNIDEAIQSFRRAVAIDPQYVLPFAGMAEAYWRRYEALKDTSSIDLAVENSARALALNDRLAPVHVTMGIIRAGKGQYEMAEAEFDKAIRLDPLNAHAWLEQAKAYDAAGKHDLAQNSFRRAIELRNDDWATLNTLGISYFRKAQYSEAEPYFLQVTQLTPDSATAWSNLGALYLKMGRFADASTQLKKSILIEPTAAGWSNLGSSYYFAGRYADAILPFEKATALTPRDSTLWGNLADAYRWTPSQASKAAPTFHHALDLIQKEIGVNPRDPQLHARAATYWAALENRERASLEIEEALSLAPADPGVQFRAALVFEQASQRDRALMAIEAALDGGYDRLEIDNSPPLRRLREDARFRNMINRNRR
jgi:eukaryotic-like serine/threonine-protein kinase